MLLLSKWWRPVCVPNQKRSTAWVTRVKIHASRVRVAGHSWLEQMPNFGFTMWSNSTRPDPPRYPHRIYFAKYFCRNLGCVCMAACTVLSQNKTCFLSTKNKADLLVVPLWVNYSRHLLTLSQVALPTTRAVVEWEIASYWSGALLNRTSRFCQASVWGHTRLVFGCCIVPSESC